MDVDIVARISGLTEEEIAQLKVEKKYPMNTEYTAVIKQEGEWWIGEFRRSPASIARKEPTGNSGKL
uniref:Uncharacterized protein n=1 Tax=Candidatus Kentrum sp. MB TaxID=2138164 RepID=A0A451B976_9GAMM|nr:MAG: hypothetical protein BECKMB1821G_GA0114241_10152 [Candidatus Kentron sp. MB]VFK29622.1 MAG: hypothetical protein BECKMB1821I_GA0114274_10111 [Candidatus Kentron sp. MB]VFK74838.1 MAG: hypothetical protein BECKMB1821H_GA0114242_10111 [Candidatus Kentron sp. MB]